MIGIDDIIVSDELLERHFACDLNACKGACCVEGDSGAPLEFEETEILGKIYPLVKEHMTPEGRETIARKGFYVKDKKGAYKTPLVQSGACAYARFENGIAQCAIQKAYRAQKVDFPKPISCHLYPVRIKLSRLQKEHVNYEEWDICSPACKLGKSQKIPLYQFVKDALIRKFGAHFYNALVEIDESRMLHNEGTDKQG